MIESEQPNTKPPILTLKRFCGEEHHYPIKQASWSIYYDEDLEMNNLCLLIEADYGTVLSEDTESLAAQPNWELNFIDKKLSKEAIKAGFRAEIPDGYEDDLNGYITNFYYCEHEQTDDNIIEILAVDNNRLLIRLQGETTDVNFYDGSKPLNKIFAETWFEYNEATQRSME